MAVVFWLLFTGPSSRNIARPSAGEANLKNTEKGTVLSDSSDKLDPK